MQLHNFKEKVWKNHYRFQITSSIRPLLYSTKKITLCKYDKLSNWSSIDLNWIEFWFWFWFFFRFILNGGINQVVRIMGRGSARVNLLASQQRFEYNDLHKNKNDLYLKNNCPHIDHQILRNCHGLKLITIRQEQLSSPNVMLNWILIGTLN